MLSVDEQKTVGSTHRQDTGHVSVPRTPRPRRNTPLAFVVLWWVCVLTMIAGAKLPGLGMAATVGLGWLLLRFLPGLADTSEAATDAPGADDAGNQPSGRGGPAASIEPARSPHITGIR